MSKNSRRNLRQRLFDQQDGKCFYCGYAMNMNAIPSPAAPDAVTVDHKIPLSKGGSNDAGNIVACCCRCNSWKADRTAYQFARVIERAKPPAPTPPAGYIADCGGSRLGSTPLSDVLGPALAALMKNRSAA